MLVTDIDRYGKLQEFLKEEKFQEADTETSNIILAVANEDRESFTPNHMLAFPCDVSASHWSSFGKPTVKIDLDLVYNLEYIKALAGLLILWEAKMLSYLVS